MDNIKKYKSFKIIGDRLYKIKALIDIPDINVKSGDIGGYIESEQNLSHKGNCWIAEDAMVYGDAEVFGDAQVYGNARVYGRAVIYGSARVFDNAQIFEDASVDGNAMVYGNANIYNGASAFEYAEVYGDAKMYGNSIAFGRSSICGSSLVSGNSCVYGNAKILGDSEIRGDVSICSDALISSNDDYACCRGFGRENRLTSLFLLKDRNTIFVVCGCFHGTLEQFKSAIKNTHGHSDLGIEYMMMVDLMERRFNRIINKYNKEENK